MTKPIKSDRFMITEKCTSGWAIGSYVLVDKQTGVNYLYSQSGYSGGLTVLVDADGKPIVTPIVEE